MIVPHHYTSRILPTFRFSILHRLPLVGSGSSLKSHKIVKLYITVGGFKSISGAKKCGFKFQITDAQPEKELIGLMRRPLYPETLGKCHSGHCPFGIA